MSELNKNSHRIEGLKLPYKLDQKPCHLENVRACGFYSIDSSGTYLADNSEMKYLYPPYLYRQTLEQPFDLNQDYDKIVPKVNVGSASLTNITKWLRENPNKTQDVDFICFRGTFSTVMISSLIENRLDWRIGAYLINKTIYLCNFDTELKKEDIKQQLSNPDSVRNSNWGFKFEQYMLSDDPVVKPDGKGELNLNREFCVLYHAKMGHFNLLYGAEMDGILKESKMNSDPSRELENVDFVELKTGKPVGLKMIKWWAQSYFVGIKNLICGEKTENEVKSLKRIPVSDILETVNYKGKKINECNCCNFILEILEFIRNKLMSYEQGMYFLFEWDPRDRFRIRAYITDNPEYKFLTQDFIASMNKLNVKEGDRIPSVSFKRTSDDKDEKRREDETSKKRRQDCDRQDAEGDDSQSREYHWDYESERRGNREYHWNYNTEHRDNRRERERNVNSESYEGRQRQSRRYEEYPVDRSRDRHESSRNRSEQDKWHSNNVLDY
uniref:Decapping nuclease n=1 Tax=Cacopsylla melanoneura TaxID=428564 RepID=A0A8D8M873_9HEMI